MQTVHSHVRLYKERPSVAVVQPSDWLKMVEAAKVGEDKRQKFEYS